MTAVWSGRRVQQARAIVEQWLPMQCGRCPHPVTADTPWVVGHIKSRAEHPELTWVISNWRPEHRACSDKTGQATVIAKAKAEALAEHGIFPAEETPDSPRPFRNTHPEPQTVREDLTWPAFVSAAPDWLTGFLDVPEDAAPPLAMSPVHPEAVGTYGPEAIEWVRREHGVTLRWWQRLAFARQLEHREDGSLCWPVILESCPRRAGKSVRLRAMALWRLDHADLFGEPQLALHTGKDVAIVREIHRQAWRWATERDGWGVRKGVGQEEVSSDDGGNRWLVRSVDSVYGYDVCLGMVDEAWAVDPQTFDEGLEPATLERSSPQLLLTSTAHRRATSLMRAKLSAALAQDDPTTLLMLWAAPVGSDPGDPETWRAASPHWTEARRRLIASKHDKALAGQADAEADDPDPMLGFVSQYLNVWRLNAKPEPRGVGVSTPEAWAALATLPDTDVTPHAAAIESWFDGGVSLALAWREGDSAITRCSDHEDLGSAVTAMKTTGYRRKVTVGSSLADDPALAGVPTVGTKQRVTDAVAELDRLLSEGGFRHDGGDHLTGQVLAVRTQPSPDGARLVSKGRADALKAAVWAASAARKAQPTPIGIVLPSGVPA